MQNLAVPAVALERDNAPDAHAIELRDLTVRFGTGTGSVLAVDRVSFSLAPGEFVSLVGPSGCGKTTILNLLTGLLTDRPEGDVRVLGKSPRPTRCSSIIACSSHLDRGTPRISMP